MIPDAGGDFAGPDGDGRDAVAAFPVCSLGAAERRVAGVGINVLPRAVVGSLENERVLVEAEFLEFVHDVPDASVESRQIESAYLLLDMDLSWNSGVGMFG